MESRPTSMLISTRNTNANYRPSFPRQQTVFQSNGSRNFKSEELFKINEGYNDSETIRDDFEDRFLDYNEDLIEADENDKGNSRSKEKLDQVDSHHRHQRKEDRSSV
ncbi:hypothetical protein FQA39_LY08022 [Lamprigera yunnana]|nr:hypothetical protein FQA39_LY08022 [Lamprigera yunnana]